MSTKANLTDDDEEENEKSKKAKVIIPVAILSFVVVVGLFVLLGLKECGSSGFFGRTGGLSSSSRSGGSSAYENTKKLVLRYADKGEYDRALSLLDKLLLENPDDEEILKLFDEIIDMKKLAESGKEPVVSNTVVNPNVNVSVDTESISSAMQSALDKQAEENKKMLEKAINETNKQNEINQKAMQNLIEKQAAEAEAQKIAAEEKREAEKAAAEQRKREEEKRKKEEEALAKKNAKLKQEIDAVNEQIRLGKTALGTGNIDEAMQYFRRAQEMLPVSDGEPAFSTSKLSEMAQALYDAAEKADTAEERKKLMEDAVSMAKSALESNQNDAAAHNIIGQDAFNKNDYQTALEEFKKAVQFDSSNYMYYYNLGKTQYIMRKYSEAASSFTTACKLNDNFSQARYNLGLAQLKQKNETAALDAFRKAIDINPRYEKAYLEQARLLSKRGDYSGSITSYKKVIEINNVNITALMEIGSVYYSDNKLELAEESFMKAIALMQPSANHTLTCFNLSTVLFEEEKYSDAVSYAKKAYSGKEFIKDEKSRANVIYNYALMLEKTGKQDDAIPIYLEVLKYDPSHNKTKINLGVMYMSLEPPDVESALILFEQVYNADSKNFEANNNLGSAFIVKEDYKNAIKFFQNALLLDSKNNDVRYNLAKAYAKDEDYGSAKATYLELLKSDNKNWDAYIELAKVCMQLGDNEKAEGYLVTVQEKQPGYRKAEVESLLSGIK